MSKLKYTQQVPRLTVKFIDAKTETVFIEINDRNHMNVGQLMSSGIVSQLIEQEFKNKLGSAPDNVMVIAVGEYTKVK